MTGPRFKHVCKDKQVTEISSKILPKARNVVKTTKAILHSPMITIKRFRQSLKIIQDQYNKNDFFFALLTLLGHSQALNGPCTPSIVNI